MAVPGDRPLRGGGDDSTVSMECWPASDDRGTRTLRIECEQACEAAGRYRHESRPRRCERPALFRAEEWAVSSEIAWYNALHE